MNTEIKTFTQVCDKMGKKDSDYAITDEMTPVQKCEMYRKRLRLIARCFNEGWVTNILDTNQYKYWPYFFINLDQNLKSGFGFALTDYYCGRTAAGCGSRPFFKSKEICLYVGKTFIKEYEGLYYWDSQIGEDD